MTSSPVKRAGEGHESLERLILGICLNVCVEGPLIPDGGSARGRHDHGLGHPTQQRGNVRGEMLDDELDFLGDIGRVE